MITKNTSYFNRVVPKGEWFPILLVRLCIGFFFAIEGLGTLFLTEKRDVLSGMLTQSAIPMVQLFVYGIPLLELVFGLLLIFGLLTTISSLILSLVMAFIMVFIKIPLIKTQLLLPWYLEFASTPEMLFFLLLFWLVFTGGGKASLDYAITASKLKKGHTAASFEDHHHHHQL